MPRGILPAICSAFGSKHRFTRASWAEIPLLMCCRCWPLKLIHVGCVALHCRAMPHSTAQRTQLDAFFFTQADCSRGG